MFVLYNALCGPFLFNERKSSFTRFGICWKDSLASEDTEMLEQIQHYFEQHH